MIRPILRFSEHPLHHRAEDVSEITHGTHSLVDDMVETMYAAPGIGLAAPQVGVAQRIFVVDLSLGRQAQELVVMINPVIEERDGLQVEEEGCLSVPGFTAAVTRPDRVVLSGLDRDGTRRRIEATALLARAFQHEMDHLDGRLFVDRLRGVKRDLIVRRIQKLKRSGRW